LALTREWRLDGLEMRVAVWIDSAFAGLAVRLSAEFLRLQQLADDRVVDLVTAEFIREPAQVLAGPKQSRHRIAAPVGFDECVQIAE